MRAVRPAAPATGIRCCWLRSGLDVLCERPLACNGKEAESMVQAARKAGRILMCALKGCRKGFFDSRDDSIKGRGIRAYGGLWSHPSGF